MRDECIYRGLANKIVDGQGLTLTQKGWLVAPGYPYLMALMYQLTGYFSAVKVLQVPLALLTLVTFFRVAERVDGRQTARLAAMGYALHPTLAYFTGTMWIETVYIFFLLNAVLAMLWAREGAWTRALLVGFCLGCATLFKGVGTYLTPIFAIAVVWPDEGVLNRYVLRRALRLRGIHAVAILLGAALTLAPYSISASQKHGGFMVSDATMGHVMFLGNNDFPPLTFDYGIGMLTGPLYARYLRTGRRPCVRTAPVVQSSACEVREATQWARDNPQQFLSRVPMRLAQLFNPHTFLTRHIRWGYWYGFPWWFKELYITYVALTTIVVVGVGSIGLWARGRGAFGVAVAGTILYTCAATMLTYGMTRFRLPLEPLWMIYVAMLISRPRLVVDALRQSTWRAAGLLMTMPALLALLAWYLPTGYPRFW